MSPNPLPTPTSRWCVPVYGEPVAVHLGPWPRAEVDVTIRNVRGRFVRWQAALASDLIVSVIPPDVAAMLGADFRPHPLWANVAADPWCGVPCDIGRVVIQFPTPGQPQPPSFFFIQVRRPRVWYAWMGTRLLLGSDFLTRARAEWWLDYVNFAPPSSAQIGEMRL